MQAAIQPKIVRLSQHLARVSAQPHVGDVRQCGLMAGIELVKDRQTKEPFPWAEKRGIRVCQDAMTEGVWLRPLGNVVVIMPPLAISLAELDQPTHPNKVLLADTMDGKPLEGPQAPFKLVTPDDSRPERSVRMVSRIRIVQAP